eukprot:m.297961 g.297961  ORF g.297961 m.297961 type:complete len:231 (-) comp55171_c0_seq16:89-781(-)
MQPTFGVHTQMTMGLFLRTPLSTHAAVAYTSCLQFKAAFPSAGTGSYIITSPATGQPTTVYCDMSLDGGGWTLTWKHSYYQVGTPTQTMTTFSKTNQSCSDLSQTWCNTPAKLQFAPTQQMIVAYHEGSIIYAYKGSINSLIDSSWQGSILLSPTRLVDKCLASIGAPPEPECGDPHAICGLTFDKTNPGVYTGNCDTDRYFNNGPDCRWENCSPAFAVHTQMTLALFVR